MASSKFEKLVEHVVNNNDKKARQLFHQIVVEKSRKIYEGLDMDDTSRAFDEVEADETSTGTDFDEFGGDESEDFESDVHADGEFEDEGEELNPEIDDRVADLESEIDALKAEFEELLGDQEQVDDQLEGDVDEEEAGLEGEETDLEDNDEDLESLNDEEDGGLEDDLDFEDEPVDEGLIREYVEKVTKGLSTDKEESFVNKKSPVAGKNEIVKGVTAKNIAAGGVEKGRTAPTSGKFTPDIVNVPGGKAKLKPTPKPVTKEVENTNKTSVIK